MGTHTHTHMCTRPGTDTSCGHTDTLVATRTRKGKAPTCTSGGQSSAVLLSKEQTHAFQQQSRDTAVGAEEKGAQHCRDDLCPLWTSTHDLGQQFLLSTQTFTADVGVSQLFTVEGIVLLVAAGGRAMMPRQSPCLWPAVSREMGHISQPRGAWGPR